MRESSAQALKLILAPSDRAVLHQRIEMRLAQMMQAGFLEEVQGLYARGDLKASDSAMRAVGYRQLWSLCAGELSYPQAMQAALVATRQLAKRQLTWLRAEPEATWFDSQDGSVPAAVQRCVQAWLSASPRP